MRIPLIIDADPGLGDAVAIAAAMCTPQIDLKALTVVAGQQSVEHTLQNMLDIVEYFDLDIEVARGAERPLFRTLVTAKKAGNDELGVFNEHIKKPSPRSALEALRAAIADSNRKVTILALGPLTNIAQLILAYPDIKSGIERIVVVGGAATGGNISPAAEFNMFVDPEAAEAVFNAQLPLTMIGLEQSHRFTFSSAARTRLSVTNGKAAQMALQAVDQLTKTYDELGWGTPAIHEALGVIYVTNPEWFSAAQLRVDIEAKGNLTRGMTVVDTQGISAKEPNTNVVTAFDRDGCMDAFLSLIANDIYRKVISDD